MIKMLLGALAVLCSVSATADDLVLDAEVMEAAAVEVPDLGQASVRYALVHHKHHADQGALARWLQRHDGASVSFRAADGVSHHAVLHRLKHCFGRGLLFYADPVPLHAGDLIRLQLADNS